LSNDDIVNFLRGFFRHPAGQISLSGARFFSLKNPKHFAHKDEDQEGPVWGGGDGTGGGRGWEGELSRTRAWTGRGGQCSLSSMRPDAIARSTHINFPLCL
jgi:hypothetical protein